MNEARVPLGIPPVEWARTPASVRAVVGALQAQVTHLQQRVTELETRLQQNSQNSSQPPARDRKANALKPKRHKQRGAKAGHAKHARAWVAKPDQVLEARVTTCAHCHAVVQAVEPEQIICHQITELPELKPLVLETRQHRVVCPHCAHVNQGVLPAALDTARQFGPRLEALVTYLQYQQHMGYERTATTLCDVFGIALSEGGEACILKRAGVAAQPAAEQIADAIRQSAVIGSDETSARLDGHNWWEWVFQSAVGVYHTIEPSRGFDVIERFMDAQRAQVWCCDCWKAQLKAPAEQFQLCLAHQRRDLQALREARPHLRWAAQMQALLGAAIHLRKQHEQITASGYQRRVTQIEHKLDQLLQRFRTHRQQLLLFLHRLDVPYDNNACERALRPSVIHRKVTGGFRSEWGAKAYAAIATLVDTAKVHRANVFQMLVNLMGKSIVHYFRPASL